MNAPKPQSESRRWILPAALIGVLLLIWVGDRAMHRMAERQVAEVLAELTSQTPHEGGLHLVWADYDSSTGEVDYLLRYGTDWDMPGTAHVKTRGILSILGVVASIQGEKSLSPEVRAVLPDFATDHWLDYALEIHWRGAHQLHAAGTPYQGVFLSDSGMRQGQLAWRAWNVTLELASDGSGQMAASFPRIWIKQDAGDRVDSLLEGLEIFLKAPDIRDIEGLLGEGELAFSRWSFADLSENLRLDQFRLSNASQLSDDRLNSSWQLTMGRFAREREREVFWDAFDLQFDSDVDFESMRRYMALDESMRVLGLIDLLRQGGRLGIEKLHVQHDSLGRLDTSLTVQLQPNRMTPGDWPGLIQALSGSANLTVDRPLMQEILRAGVRTENPHLDERAVERRMQQQWLQWSIVLPLLPITTRWDDDGFDLSMDLNAGIISVDGRRVMNFNDLARLF